MKLSAITRRFIFVVFLAVLCGGYAHAQRLVIVGWNIESGGATNAAVAQRVRSFQGVDLWGLAEVGSDTSLQSFEVAAEDGENADFKRLLSQTGCGDRLGIVFNATRLQLVASQELHRVTYNADQPSAGRCQRSPLVAEFQDTRSNRRFLFMVNHLARGDNSLRRDQAQRLNEWVRTQTLPVIACGDYNFDWRLTSVILQEANDCGNAAANPDHRPLRAEFELGAVAPTPTRAELLQRIEALERQIQELRAMIQRLP